MVIDIESNYFPLLLVPFALIYILVLEKLIGKFFKIRKLLKDAEAISVTVVRFDIKLSTDDREVLVPIVKVENIGEFPLLNVIATSESQYEIGERISIHFAKDEPSNSVLEGSNIDIFLGVLIILFGLTPFFGCWVYFFK
jgi:hypothetical protein